MKCCGFVLGASVDREGAEEIVFRWRITGAHLHSDYIVEDQLGAPTGPPPRPPTRARKPRKRSGSVPKAVRKRVYARDGYSCRYCGILCTDRSRTLDHVIPVSAGGPSTVENLVVACGPCNVKKGSKV